MHKTDGFALLTTLAGIFGSITFTDAYQGLSFVVLVLTAVHWILRIRKQLRDD